MIKANRAGVNINDNTFSCSVVLAIAMQHRTKGTAVLIICHEAILLSLAM